MLKRRRLPPAENAADYNILVDRLTNYVTEVASSHGPLNILEAGCGTKWTLDLRNVSYTLTGVDLDKDALDIRINKQKDLNVAINADLRTVSFADDSFDVIFSENVLEHVDGADRVLESFVKWLKPGGIMILLFPNGDSAFAFVTRMIPFGLHVCIKKYLAGISNAGKPGYGPYPVFLDDVVSRSGIHEFCEKNGLVMKAEYRRDIRLLKSEILWFFVDRLFWGLSLLSFGRVSADHKVLVYVIEKPGNAAAPDSAGCQGIGASSRGKERGPAT